MNGSAIILSIVLLPATSLVTTVAGTGTAGFSDGPASAATFMAPAGIAFDAATRTTYVSDFAAQRIRKIDANGIVTTVAGSGMANGSGLDVAGGYLDGPALSARFNRPTGIAIGVGGALYVADSLNHCIRKIENGSVSTFTGHADSAESKDGALGDATYHEPRSIAIAHDGTMYVADFGYGIRTISKASVSTFAPKSSPGVTSVALLEDRSSRYLFAASPADVARYDLRSRAAKIITETPGFYPSYGFTDILPIDASTALVGSARYGSVLSADFDCDRSHETCVRTFAGSDDEDENQSAGFKNGAFADARFFNPIGMARIGENEIDVSDASNRMIRSLRWSGSK